MIVIETWMQEFLTKLDDTFGSRVWFVGLQGSYGRGEATESSDVDAVVILDTLSPADIHTYSRMLDTLPHRELICGFLSGKEEIANWEASDLFQLYYDTTPIRGSMEQLLPLLDGEAVARAIKIGACNIYHGCVHNMVHGKNDGTLVGLYKTASFVVQAIAFQQTGCYCRCQQELLEVVQPQERMILETYMEMKKGRAIRFQEMSEILFTWCQTWIAG